jgi:uncharacterized integral membrane protein (TIGR00698 family)
MSKEVLSGLFFSVFTGLTGYTLSSLIRSPLFDPLVISLILGIGIRTIVGGKKYESGFAIAPKFLIPVGIIFYAVKNLNFVKFADVQPKMSVLMLVVVFIYFVVIFILGKILGQKKQITCLTATGSAICGASAIAITSPAVEADPDDTAISLLSVTLAAMFGFAVILPFLATLFDITGRTYSLMSGSVMQFTGLVKAAVRNIPYLTTDMTEQEMLNLALSVKSIRYLGLLLAIPLMSSFIKKKIHLPWVLWVFLLAGLSGTYLYTAHGAFYNLTLTPVLKPVHNISWSIAMSAIGLNADVKQMFSNNGAKSLVMAFAGFLSASVAFFIGLYIFSLF